MSPCAAAVVDSGMILGIDGTYSAPSVAQFNCKPSNLLDGYAEFDACARSRTASTAPEMFVDINPNSTSNDDSSGPTMETTPAPFAEVSPTSQEWTPEPTVSTSDKLITRPLPQRQ